MYAWRKEGEHSVLARINPADIRGIFGKNIVINPGEAGFRRKNGISEEIKKEGIFPTYNKVMNMSHAGCFFYFRWSSRWSTILNIIIDGIIE